ncbi:MAG: hypothetical protein GC187_13455 [Alphaproteobacteria bacterium]|nr:hypothetical protein [Alphaproteobacteria bacterium]
MRISRFAPYAVIALGLFIAAIFLDSLRFKFTGHPTPQHIFETLRDWSGIDLFYPVGPWVIGLAELASALLLLTVPVLALFIRRLKGLGALSAVAGALIALAVMSGAIGFHMFTPLGIETPVAWEDGRPAETSPALFYAACLTWMAAFAIVLLQGGAALRALRREG